MIFVYDDKCQEFVMIVPIEQRTNAAADVRANDMTHVISGQNKRGKQVDTKSQGVNPSMLASEEGSQADTESQGINLIKASFKVNISNLQEVVKYSCIYESFYKITQRQHPLPPLLQARYCIKMMSPLTLA